ncbi:MAG: zinc transporter ZupT [Spirochaetia bacterium]|nr:zinc transporter ZupT [Spirochaetia bacterium]
MNISSVGIPFLLTLIAGAATGIGGATVFFSRKLRPAFLSVSLGFSAGVMIYVSMIEIFPKAKEALEESFSAGTSSWVTVVSFFAGIALIMLIDTLIPEADNPHELKDFSDPVKEADSGAQRKLLRMGLMSALAIGIHNFPEGLATFMSAVHDPRLGFSIAAAIAIHNIPEGIAVAVPVYYATKNRRRAFGLSMLSGLAEPVGGLIGFGLLYLFAMQLSAVSTVFGVVFAAVAGIMVYISIDELLPTAEKYGKHHYSIYGLVAGMIVMALSLLLFG